MTQKFVNNFRTTVAATFGTTDTTLQLASTAGLPTLAGADFIYLTVFNLSGVAESGHTVVKVTSYTGNQCTVVRDIEGAVGTQFLTGAVVEARVTALSMMDKANAADTTAALATKADAAATTAALNTLTTDVAARPTTSTVNAALALKADITYVTTQINNLINGAGATLDTLNELAAALGNDANFATTVTNSIATKLAKAGGSMTGALNLARATVASHATTADIWGAAGNDIDWTGTATTTAFPAAPQAGARRTLICASTPSFTAGANLIIDGVTSGATVTLAANDKVNIRAITTTQFMLTIDPAAGTVNRAGSNMVGNLSYSRIDKGTVGTGTVTFDVQAAFEQRLQVSGALTIAFSNWPASGIDAAIKLKLVNAGSAVVTMPTINWIKPDGTQTTTFATYLTAINRPALQSAGTDFALIWSDDAGATLYGKLV